MNTYGYETKKLNIYVDELEKKKTPIKKKF